MDHGKRSVRGSSRQVIVVDDEVPRRTSLIDRLVAAGFTPLAPTTPLDMFDLLNRNHGIEPVLVAPNFVDALKDSFPEYVTQPITDDVDGTVARLLLMES